MKRSSHYLIAYDICSSSRLKKVHQFLKKEGLAVQYSVFLVSLSSCGLRTLLAELKVLINEHEDDVRAYPILWPNRFWVAGKSEGVFDEGMMISSSIPSKKATSKESKQ